METRANFIFVGLFLLATIFSGFLFVWWVGNFEDSKGVDILDIRISGSVSGLKVGTEVQFNGIHVGRVQSVNLDSELPNHVLVRTILTEEVPIRSDTQASIGTLGLTGRAYVRLEGGSSDGTRILDLASPPESVAMLEGSPATLDNVLARLSAVATRADNIVGSLETLVETNAPVITSTLSNIESFSQILADNNDGVDALLSGASNISASITGLSDRLDGTITQVESIVGAVDPEQVKRGVDDLTATLSSAREFTESLDANEFSSLISDLRSTTSSISNIFNATNSDQVSETISSLSRTAELIERVSSTVANRSDEIDAIIVDTDEFITEMRSTASTLNIFIEQLGEMVSGEDGQGVLASTQRTLDRFDRILSNIEQNPNSLVFGSPPLIPESGE